VLNSLVFRPTRRLYQPPGLVGINRSSPFAAGLLWACIPGDISICSDPKSPTISGGYTLAVGLAGRGAKGPATQVAGKVSYAASINIAASQDYAFATFAIPSTDTTTGTSGIIELVGSNTNFLAAASNGARAQVDNNITALNTWTRTEPNLFLASRKGGTAYCYTPAGVITAATGTRSQVITEVSVGRASGNNLSNPHHFLVLVWGRHISVLEYAALAANPLQVLTFGNGVLPIGLPSGGTIHTASYSDSATATDAVTAVFVAAAAIGETATAGDAFTAALVTSAAYSDAAAPADDYAATLVAAGQSDYSDTATPLDSILAALVTSASWADAAVPVDAIAAALVAQRDYAESAAPADAYDAVVISGSTNAYSDQAAPLDAYAAVLIARAAYAETCSAQDSYAALLPGEADTALRRSVHVRLSDQAPVVRMQSQSPVAKL